MTATLLVICGIGLASADQATAQASIDVTLLGTGTPVPALDRFGPSTLVQAGDQTLVFDAGRGVMQRLAQAGVRYAEIDALFLTHFHSDHIVGLPDLWLTGWLTGLAVGPAGPRTRPLTVIGPRGTADLMRYLTLAYAFDLDIRTRADHLPREGSRFDVVEIDEGTVYEQHGVKVRAFAVKHGDIAPALGYRIEYAGRSVVLSGDTQYSERLLTAARGVDLLIHEVAGAAGAAAANPAVQSILGHHTTADRAAALFAEARPK
ncbi:MAG TPA: MBL fold metallo-hydrolase, partial [Vicinamibacterales bacterium]|nr:MBL fold metallo-hydrolase [Vicinamibacterales bacterium]